MQLPEDRLQADLQINNKLTRIILTEILFRELKITTSLIIISLRMDWSLVTIATLITDHRILTRLKET